MSVPRAIIIGATIIGIAIILGRIITPYEIASGPAATAWRVNTITGKVEFCKRAPDESMGCL